MLVFAVFGYLSMFLTPKHFLPLYFSVASLLAAIIVDFNFYRKFFFLKTTKHGLSIGASILLFFVLVVALNFIFFKHNKSWDLTSEKLHSLSDQTSEILKGLENSLEFKVFLIKGRPAHDSLRNTFDSKIRLYKQAGNVNVTYINPQLEPAISKEYNITESGAIVLEYGEKRTEIDTSSGGIMMGTRVGITEQDITNAIIKVTRENDKVLYFLSNHGELDIMSGESKGGMTLKTELEALSYQVKTLSFIQTEGKIPESADAIFILGPTQPLLKAEIQALEGYLKSGGNLLIAIDPETKHGMDSILDTLGLRYKNEYVIDQMAALLGDVPVTALGVKYSQTSDITKKLASSGAASLFFMVSGFERINDAGQSFEYDEVVQTDVTTVSISKLTREIGPEDVTERGPFSIVYSVTGSFDENDNNEDNDNEEEENKFLAIVYGDSDIFSNGRIFQQLNRDLVLNTVSALLRDKDLINIRPKASAQTVMASFTTTKYRLFNVIPFLLMPVLLIIFGLAVSYRRKGL